MNVATKWTGKLTKKKIYINSKEYETINMPVKEVNKMTDKRKKMNNLQGNEWITKRRMLELMKQWIYVEKTKWDSKY